MLMRGPKKLSRYNEEPVQYGKHGRLAPTTQTILQTLGLDPLVVLVRAF